MKTKTDDAVPQVEEADGLEPGSTGACFKRGDDLSQWILEKWRKGVIICLRPPLFYEDDDVKMI